MADIKLRDRPTRPSLKKQESSAIAGDEAYMEFYTLVFNIKREAQMHENISGTCSESIMNKGVIKLKEMKNLQDNAYTTVKGRALSDVSSKTKRKYRDLRIYLDQLQNQLRHEKDSPPEVENNKCSLPDDKNTADAITRENASLKTSYVNKEHTMCAPEVKNRLVVNKQTDATGHHNYIADDIASYPASCTYSDGTIEDYLNNKWDYDYYHDVPVTTQMNMIQFASIMNDFINASRLPIPEPKIFTGNPLEYPSWKCSFEALIETKSILANHRIHYLKKYLSGEANTAVECIFLNAKEMLEKIYGNPSLISEATSFPGCANFALKSLANSSRNAYSNDTIDFLLNSFYVDDGLYSAKTVEDAWMVVNESIPLCSSRNLRLHKFVSNNINLLNKIPESERAASIHSIDLTLQSLPIERALGSVWDTKSDSLQFNVKVPIHSNPPDRRSV